MTDIDLRQFADWLRLQDYGFGELVSVRRFEGGQSNPTYLLEAEAGTFVLRRKPFGTTLPSAHAVEREFELLSKLHPAGFPVARPIALCEDPAAIGAPFYVMEHVDGRTFWDARLPRVPKAERSNIHFAMLSALARLHKLPVEMLRPDATTKGRNYLSRQISRWITQYRAAQSEEIGAIEKLIEWLPQHMPAQQHIAIVHGDYRIDNVIFDRHRAEVAVVIDWELATLGDPLADLSYLLMNWHLPADGQAALGNLDLAALGLPTADELLARYAVESGIDVPDSLDWYFAFNLFRGAAIIQGIRQRLQQGNASSKEAAQVVDRLRPMAEAGWSFALRAGA